MNKINMFFKMAIVSLVLIFYRSFYMFQTGIDSFFDLFGYPNDTIDSILFFLLNAISVLGSILLFYSIIMFFIECIKYSRESK